MPLYFAGGGGATLAYDYVAGENLALYEVVYGDAPGAAARVKKAVNTSETTSRVIGVVSVAAITGATATVMQGGQAKMKFTGGSPVIGDAGKPVYLSAVAGQVTLTAPVAVGSVVIRVGYLVGYGANDNLVNIEIGDPFVL